ncbi:MAG: hypothetical protein NXI30_15670 [bacterium]|nr:hypothetical protein [bacterium]
MEIPVDEVDIVRPQPEDLGAPEPGAQSQEGASVNPAVFLLRRLQELVSLLDRVGLRATPLGWKLIRSQTCRLQELRLVGERILAQDALNTDGILEGALKSSDKIRDGLPRPPPLFAVNQMADNRKGVGTGDFGEELRANQRLHLANGLRVGEVRAGPKATFDASEPIFRVLRECEPALGLARKRRLPEKHPGFDLLREFLGELAVRRVGGSPDTLAIPSKVQPPDVSASSQPYRHSRYSGSRPSRSSRVPNSP